MEKTAYARRANAAGVRGFRTPVGIRPAVVLWVLGLGLVASALLVGFLTPGFLLPAERPTTALVAASYLLSLAGISVGALVASRLPRNPVGWIFLSMGSLYGMQRLAEAYADYALLSRPGLPLGEVAAWTSTWLGFSWLAALGALLVVVFPDGRLPSALWRATAIAVVGGAVLIALGEALRFGPLPAYYYVNNPFAGGWTLRASSPLEASTIVGGALLCAGCLASIAALALRLRRARGQERRRLAWFAYAAVPALLISAAAVLNWSIERLGIVFLGKTLSPVLRLAEASVLFAKADRTAGTLNVLRLDANLELVGACVLLTMPVCAFVAMRRHGLYGLGSASPLTTSGVLRALAGGAAAGVLPLAFVYLAVFLYVVFYPLVWRGELGQEQLGRVVTFVNGWGAQAFFLAAAFLVAFLVARQARQRAVVLGTLVGLVAASVDRTISSFLDPPVALGAAASYLSLGLAGGYFGGLAGRSTLSGGVYRVSQRIGTAKDASAVAATIGENLGDARAEGVAVWRMDDGGERTLAAYGGESRAALWGSWVADGREGWPSGLAPGPVGESMLAAPGERSWAAEERGQLPPDERKSWERSGIRSALFVPLAVPGEAWSGLLMVTFAKRLRFSGRAARAYLTVASQAALVLENLRLVEEARQAGRRRGILVERQRLAREIHDTLAQGFTGVVTNLTAAELAASAMDGARAQYVENAKRIARDSLAEARRLVWALRPESLDRFSLPEAVSNLVREWSERTGIAARATSSGTPRELLPEVEVALLRAAQESLANVHKHAGARAVNVTLTYMNDRVIVDVLDDGCGFDPAGIKTSLGPQDERGFGLTAMRERVEQLGGRLAIESAPGEGTVVVVEVRDGEFEALEDGP